MYKAKLQEYCQGASSADSSSENASSADVLQVMHISVDGQRHKPSEVVQSSFPMGVSSSHKDDKKIKDMAHLYKNQLQIYTQKRNINPPVYIHEREGPLHSLRFKSKVTIDGKTYESAEFYRTLKDAENAAAKVALISTSSNNIEEEYSGFYKNLLQELAQQKFSCLPEYKTTCSGPSHNPTFASHTSKPKTVSTRDLAKLKRKNIQQTQASEESSKKSKALESDKEPPIQVLPPFKLPDFKPKKIDFNNIEDIKCFRPMVPTDYKEESNKLSSKDVSNGMTIRLLQASCDALILHEKVHLQHQMYEKFGEEFKELKDKYKVWAEEKSKLEERVKQAGEEINFLKSKIKVQEVDIDTLKSSHKVEVESLSTKLAEAEKAKVVDGSEGELEKVKDELKKVKGQLVEAATYYSLFGRLEAMEEFWKGETSSWNYEEEKKDFEEMFEGKVPDLGAMLVSPISSEKDTVDDVGASQPDGEAGNKN